MLDLNRSRAYALLMYNLLLFPEIETKVLSSSHYIDRSIPAVQGLAVALTAGLIPDKSRALSLFCPLGSRLTQPLNW